MAELKKKNYVFAPKKDIRSHELAAIVKIMLMDGEGPPIKDNLLKRHFKVKK